MKFFKKPFVYAGFFTAALILFTLYVMLDTFIIPHVETSVTQTAENDTEDVVTPADDVSGDAQYVTGNASAAEDEMQEEDTASDVQNGEEAVQNREPDITENSYDDGNITINISTVREYDTDIYVADIYVKSAEYLKTAIAQNTYGTNITEKTSSMAQKCGAILAVNGDYYGANKRGYVIKNGVLYRDSMRSDAQYNDLVIYADGSFEFVNENEISAQELLEKGVEQLFAFGPELIENGEVAVSENDEVGKAMSSNPRTAIGIIDELHYVLVVSDGRTDESEGLSLYELAVVMREIGCKAAYNLDGGGSSTMYFNGEVVNNPTTSGRKTSERAVSDIVYIGY